MTVAIGQTGSPSDLGVGKGNQTIHRQEGVEHDNCNDDKIGDDYHYLQEGGPPADSKVLAVHAVHLGLLRHPGGRDDDLDDGGFNEYFN